MIWQQFIDSDRRICGGRSRLIGTRRTVEFLIGLKAAGWSDEAILGEYQQLHRDRLPAVFCYAHALFQHG